MYLVKEIWIITCDGITIFNQRIEENVNKDIFGGFINAIDTFSRELGENGCNNIVMGSSQLTINSCEDTNVLIVCRSDINIAQKKIEKYLLYIKKCFLENYGDVLKNWNGDIGIFDGLKQYINIKDDRENYLGVKLDKEKSKAVLDKL